MYGAGNRKIIFTRKRTITGQNKRSSVWTGRGKMGRPRTLQYNRAYKLFGDRVNSLPYSGRTKQGQLGVAIWMNRKITEQNIK